MSAVGGPNIVEDGLVLYLDAANVKSFRGEPTVNLAANGGLIGMSGITLTYITDEDGWKKYSMSGTFTGGSYPYIMHVTSVSFTGGLQYTTRCTIKTNVMSKFNYFGTSTGMNYVNVPMTNSGASVSISNSDGSYTVGRTGFIYTNNTTQPGYILSNPINNTTFNSSTDFVWIRDLQIEQKPYPTPFVNGTRGTTVATGGGWVDRSGNGNHGELVNGPTFDSDNLGSIAFDGVDDSIIVPNSSPLQITNNISVMFWMYVTAQVGGQGIITKGPVSNDYDYMVYLTSNSTNISFYKKNVGAVGEQAAGFTGTFIGRWTHIAFSLDTLSVSGYENGVIKATSSFLNSGIRITNNDLRIGRGWNAYFPGKISNVQIYNRALTPQEILQNYNATKGRYGL